MKAALPSTQKFMGGGQWRPLALGEIFEGMRVDHRQAHLDGYFYQVSTAQGSAVLHETPAYFQPLWQQKVWQGVQSEMALQGLAGPAGPLTFQRSWQGLTLQYVLYPERVGPLLQKPLAKQCWQRGLPSEAQLRGLYTWMRTLQQGLAVQGWINPALALPNLVGSFEEPLLLDWSCSVPLDNTLVFPRFLLGYHGPFLPQVKKEDQADALTLAWQGAFTSFLALLQGKPPRFWLPEPINARAIYYLLTPEMRQWLEAWSSPQHPEMWPDLPEQIYLPPVTEYAQATQQLHRGLEALHLGEHLQAEEHGRMSACLWSTDPWAHFLLARCAEATQDIPRALTFLKIALRSQSLAVFWREKSRLYLKQSDLYNAERCVCEALERVSEDDAAWYLYSQIAAHRKQWSKAEDTARRACVLRPLNTVYQKHLKQLLHYLGDPESKQGVSRFAAGQLAHLTQSLAPSSSVSSPLERVPEGWILDPAALTPPANNGPVNVGVIQQDSGQKGFLKRFDLPDLVLKMDFLSQERLLSVLTEDGKQSSGFLPLLHQSVQGTQGVAIYPWRGGHNLQSLWSQNPLITTAEWNQIAAQAASILHRLAAQQIVHADISPANLLWHEGLLTLVDYENLHALDILDRPARRAFRTTPEYSAPELYREHCSSLSVDRYSMALVLLQAATGIFPDLCRHWTHRDFSGYTRYAAHLPAPVLSALLAATQWDSEQRQDLPFDAIAVVRSIPPWLQSLSESLTAVAQATTENYESLQKALLAQESTVLSYYHLAYHGQRVGDLESARYFARACLRLAPGHQGAHWVLASVLCEQSLWEAALELLQQALSYTIDEPETYRLLLQIYCQQGKLEMALATCQHLERCLPYHAEARLERVLTLSHFGLRHQAAEALSALAPHQIPLGLKAQIFRESKTDGDSREYLQSR